LITEIPSNQPILAMENMRTFNPVNIVLIASTLVFIVGCNENEQPSSTPGQTSSQTENKEVGLTTSDGEYQLWESMPVDTSWRYSNLKTIEGGSLEEWGKLHPIDWSIPSDKQKAQ
jgi:hypothetical protein